ncbi:MAG: ATP-binding cassette domain-containing protein [Acidimicrobiia bacterium]|nr:ATP-binding cassette domain-containing protein [Acidimicrobiia bacterium]
MSESSPLLQVDNLVTQYRIRRAGQLQRRPVLRAVDDVSLTIDVGETLGVVGESGGGKTTLGLSILRLVPAERGTVTFQQRDVLGAGRAELKELRRQMQIILQDPVGALDPRKTIADSVAEGLRIQRLADKAHARGQAIEMLDRVGLTSTQARRYPHELSGGQLQRAGIARALVVGPRLVVCDEPVSALDPSIQAQIINLLTDLQRERELAFLFIAHNLGVVRHISDRIAVMYLGRIVETGPTADLFQAPAHPYTRALLSSIPTADAATRRDRIVLSGEVPSPVAPPGGCRFRTRCPSAMPRCVDAAPELKEHRPGHSVACFLHE